MVVVNSLLETLGSVEISTVDRNPALDIEGLCSKDSAATTNGICVQGPYTSVYEQ
jgi:hypothetical protein